jgi:hypothetical protein
MLEWQKINKQKYWHFWRTVNKNGMRLVDFAVYNNLRILNTVFSHKKYTNIPAQLGTPNQ